MLASKDRTLLDAIALARRMGIKVDNPVSGPEYERVILTLHRAGIGHNMSGEPYTKRIVAGRGDYQGNPGRRVSKRARKYIGRTIRRLAHRGEQAPRRVAIAHAKARRRGFRVPKKARRGNPQRGTSERKAWEAVRSLAASVIRSQARQDGVADPSVLEIESWAKMMLAQLGRGIHENPLLGVVGNPPQGARRLASQVYELRYRHAQGRQENFRHPFRAGAEAFCLPGGAILIRHRRGLPLWKDFPDAR